MPPLEIWTCPPVIGSLIWGAEMTRESRTIAKNSLTCARVWSANSCLPASLRTKLTVRCPFWSDPTVAVSSWSPLNRTLSVVRSSVWPSVGGVIVVGIGTKSRRPV